MPDYRKFDMMTECGLAGEGWQNQEDCDCSIKSPHSERCTFEVFEQFCDYIEGVDYGAFKNTGD